MSDCSVHVIVKNLADSQSLPSNHSPMCCTGVRFELYYTPGESGDQLTVWLPDERVAMPGDNIYKAFPNIYSIKGDSARDAIK